MKTWGSLVGLVVVGVVMLSGYGWTRRDPGPSTGVPVRFDVTGVVTAPSVGRQVSIAHDDIPGFMPAMTMPFMMGTGVDVAALRPGDRVRFVLQVGSDASEAHSLSVTGHDQRVAAAAAATTVTTGVTAPRMSRVRQGDPVPAFALRDQSDTPFTERDLAGHATVVTFIFTRCPLPEFCPLMVKRFRELQSAIADNPALRERTRLLSVTLDPAFDSPEVLHAYGTAMGADFSRWRFVTGAPEAIDAVARAFAVYSERSGPALDHTLATALIGPDGRVVEIWRGNGWKPADVLAAVRLRHTSMREDSRRLVER